MRRFFFACGIAAALSFSFVQLDAQAPKKPANATAECQDGTWSAAKTKTGACSSHGGIKTWLADEQPAAKKSAKASGKEKTTAKAATTTAQPKSTAAPNATTAAAPANATGQCKDGSYTMAATKAGACSGHGGVGTWLAASAKAETKSSAPKAAVAPAPVPSTPVTSAPASTPAKTSGKSGKAQIVAPPPGTPENATAQCNDGTYSFAKNHQGACSGHKGVKSWFK